MPALTVAGQPFFDGVGSVSIHLRFGSLPVFVARAPEGHEVVAHPAMGAPAILGGVLSFEVVEPVAGVDAAHCAGVIGAVVPETVANAFTGAPMKILDSAQVRRIVWQRQDAVEFPSGWDFVNRICGDLFANPSGGVTDLIGAAFPKGSVFIHPAGMHRRRVIERLFAELNATSVGEDGHLHWLGYGAGDAPPLRMVSARHGETFEMSPDEWTWRASKDESEGGLEAGEYPSEQRAEDPGGGMRHRGVEFVRRTFRRTVSEAMNDARLLAVLAQFIQGQPVAGIPASPGLCDFGGRLLWCRGIGLHATFARQRGGNGNLRATLEMGERPLTTEPGAQIIAGASFAGWYHGDPKTTDIIQLTPDKGADWALAGMTPNCFEVDSKRTLWSRVLTPAARQESHVGFYRTYRSRDPLHVTVQNGQVPVAHGGFQVHNPTFEKAALSLHAAELIAVSTPVSAADNVALDALAGLRVSQVGAGESRASLATAHGADKVAVGNGGEQPGVVLGSEKKKVRADGAEGVVFQKETIHFSEGEGRFKKDVTVEGTLDVQS